jgi:hypothetical protein
MNVHKKLMKKYKWYRAWHHNPYANLFHILIVLLMFSYNLYLLLEILKHVKKI